MYPEGILGHPQDPRRNPEGIRMIPWERRWIPRESRRNPLGNRKESLGIPRAPKESLGLLAQNARRARSGTRPLASGINTNYVCVGIPEGPLRYPEGIQRNAGHPKERLRKAKE